MAAADEATMAPPTLVNNVETLAHVPGIVLEGPERFRATGTRQSPGTVVCTVTGHTRRHGVAEVPMGTPLAGVIERIGGGVRAGHDIAAVMTGVSNPLVPGNRLDTPVSYEHMEAIGTGLGTAGFIVFDDTTDFTAVAHGVSRFLAIESCGQCTPCKQDGLALLERFDRLRRSEATQHDLDEIHDHIRSVADEARCFLAIQHQRVAGSILEQFSSSLEAHIGGGGGGGGGGIEPADEVIAPIIDIEGGTAVLDQRQLNKQPDWTYDETDSGRTPADRIDQRSRIG
jgi:NADH:ubiquinone oxidoreductase subunit F (NADH-binding)